MKRKKTQLLIAFFIGVITLSGCGGALEKSYSCKCEDLWGEIKGHEYEEFEAAWGSPMDTDSQWEQKKIGYKWKIDGLYDCNGSDPCGEIWVWFEGAQSENGEILPMGNCKYANCYNGGDESFRQLIGNE